MCGIAGISRSLASDNAIRGALDALKERGPDHAASKDLGQISFLHTRLRIIDLSENGNQPITNEDNSIWLVFNGEIYNYRSLRKELLEKGHVFKGDSDSEVIVHLYEEVGEKIWTRLRGMFAAAIYDTRKKELHIGRDRFGIKPLFYYHKGNDFAFSSNINAIKNIPGTDLKINRQSVSDFTSFLYIPAPQTFYSHITALMPGSCIRVSFGDRLNITTQTFHTWDSTLSAGLSEEEALEQVDHLLEKAVISQLESDVPIGALLSGGIDSSLVCSVAQKHLGEKRLNTFNVKFPDAVNDETWAAVSVAKHIGSSHHTLSMDSQTGSWEQLSDVLSYCGQPFGDTSIFAVNNIAHLIRKHVIVCLSGDGGDEGFAGYDTFLQIEKVNRLLAAPAFLRSILFGISGMHALMPARASTALRKINYFKGQDSTGVIQNFHVWLRNEEHRKLLRNAGSYEPVRRFFEPLMDKAKKFSGSSIEQLSFATSLARTELHLPNDYLFKVDSGTMKASIENRVPFLDEDLFAFGLSLPHKLKTQHGRNKYLLRKIASKRLPDEVVNKPKWGFGLPVDLWVNDECRREIVDRLNADSNLSEVLNPDIYKPWIKAFECGESIAHISREGLYQRIIMLASLHLHFR